MAKSLNSAYVAANLLNYKIMLNEFKKFAFKGNVMDMAVGIIIGGAFSTVVKSLVDNVFMPPLGMMIANVDFTKLKWVLKENVPAELNDQGEVLVEATPEVAVAYGQFITDSISFLLLAFAVFLVVKKLIAAFEKKEEEKAAEPPKPSKEEVLLTEIRDLLKEKV